MDENELTPFAPPASPPTPGPSFIPPEPQGVPAMVSAAPESPVVPVEQPFDVLGMRNAAWGNQAQTVVNLEVNFRSTDWLPFTATAADPLPHMQDVWARIQAGEADPIAAFVPVVVVPPKLTFRQFVLALKETGFLTAAEALAAAETRARPAQLETLLAGMPEELALDTKITWATMTEVFRTDALFAGLIQAGIATTEQIDYVFVLGASK